MMTNTTESRKRRPRVALVKIQGLAPYLQQVYAPLLERYEITCFALEHMSSAREAGPIPTVYLKHPLGNFRPVTGVMDRLTSKVVKRRFVMPNLSERLRDFDLVEAVDLVTAPALQVARGKRMGHYKMVLACAENIPFPLWEMPSKRTEAREVAAASDHFLPLTRQAADVLRLIDVPDEKITIVPHGIDCTLFAPGERDKEMARRLGVDLEKEEAVGLFVGRLVWEKGVQDIITAMALLTMRGESTPLILIAGSGEEENFLKTLAREAGLDDRVRFVGPVAHADLPSLYRLADFSLVPSIPRRGWMEQFGVVAIEAMACALPVIAGASGALPEVVDEGGIAIPPHSPEELAEAIVRLSHHDPMRKHMGEAGRTRVLTHYNAAHLHKTIDKVYTQVLNS